MMALEMLFKKTIKSTIGLNIVTTAIIIDTSAPRAAKTIIVFEVLDGVL